MSRTILKHVLATGKPFLEPDIAANFDVSGQASVKRLALRAVFAYPIEFQGKHLGVIYLDWRKRWPKRRVEEIQEMLASFARGAAIVLEHARLCAEAIHDRLTGAYTRAYCEQRMRQEIDRARRGGRPFSYLLLDLDRFALVNDIHGVEFGDRVLCEVGRRVAGWLRGGDIAASRALDEAGPEPGRHGGDEFELLLPETPSEDARRVAERICRALEREAVVLDGKTLWVTASVGVATFPDHADSAESLTRAAEEALYLAKRSGRNRVEAAKAASAARAAEDERRALAHDADLETLAFSRDAQALLGMLTRLLGGALDLDRRIEVMLDTLGNATGADVAHLVLLGHGEQAGRILTRGLRGGASGATPDPASNVVVEAVQSGVPVRIADVTQEPRTRDEAARTGRVGSVLCVPLLTGVRPFAAVLLEVRSREHRFTQEDEALVAAFARKAAPSLQEALVAGERDAELSRMRVIVEEALRSERLRYDWSNVVAESRAMKEVLRSLDRMVDSPYPLLLLGESGSGKELLARAVHYNGPRKAHPFFAVNCAALSETLLDSELFGHVRGAFTGAEQDRVGVFEAAGEGTLFLDEVGEMSPGMQVKILRAIEQREVRPVGGRETIPVRCRLICATNRDLEEMVGEGLFREDLFYRLAVLRARVPPLRERPEDVSPLVERMVRGSEGQGLAITPEALARLQQCTWRGNVRELESEVKRLQTLGIRTVREEDLSASIRGVREEARTAQPAPGPADGQTLSAWLDECERAALHAALAAAGGNRQEAAKALGINRVTLYRKLERLGMAASKGDPPEA
ncbi:MAG: sigma 54-interacting transcriptional regulator [Planctomycetota bacterium]